MAEEDGHGPPLSKQFADVARVPQNDGPHPVVPIAYAPEYVEACDYFRAMLAAKEYSERSLALTAAVIRLNPANYTAWYFRRKCIDHLEKDLKKELDYCELAAIDSPKNYQVWYHRRSIVSKIGEAPREMDFTRLILEDDSKNYHAWAHRQWVLRNFGGWEAELTTIDELLELDIRNNSAWNQRWFAIENSSGFSHDVRAREIGYAFQRIEKAINNESPWNYLRGLVRGQESSIIEPVLSRITKLFDSNSAASMCVPLRSLQADLMLALGDQAGAEGVFSELQSTLDPTRERYWAWRREGLLSAVAPASS